MSSASSIPSKIRTELLDTIEDIGQAAALLREAIQDADSSNLPGGQMCASDALEILSTLETRFSEMSAAVCAWAENSSEETPAHPPMEDRWDYDHGPDHMREVNEEKSLPHIPQPKPFTVTNHPKANPAIPPQNAPVLPVADAASGTTSIDLSK